MTQRNLSHGGREIRYSGRNAAGDLGGARGALRALRTLDALFDCARALSFARARRRLAGAADDVGLGIVLMRDESAAATAARRQLKYVGIEEAHERPRARQIEHGLGIAMPAMLEVEPITLRQRIEMRAAGLVFQKEVRVIEKRSVNVRKPRHVPIG